MRWTDFVAAAPERDLRRLVLAVTTGLHEARLAAELLRDDGEVDELCQGLDVAVGWLQDARRLLYAG